MAFTFAITNLPPVSASTPFPVVLLSHGVTGGRPDMQTYAEHLASHGYVVVCPDHYDCSSVVYPDGTFLFGPEGRSDTHTSVGLQRRIADLRFLADQLDQWNQTDSLLAGRLNLQAIAAMGYSWGGPTVGEFCRTDARCKAVISLDGGWWEDAPELTTRGLQKPSLSIHSPINTTEILFGRATRDAYWFQITGADHADFFAYHWWWNSGGIAAAREVTRIVEAYSLAFLNHYIKGQDESLLDGPQGTLFPRQTNFRRK